MTIGEGNWIIYLNLGEGKADPPLLSVAGVEVAPDVSLAIGMALTGRYKAIVLDVGSETREARVFLNRLRSRSKLPVLMLVSKTASASLPDLYGSGADAHLFIPVPEVLLDAKLFALFRRAYVLSIIPKVRRFYSQRV